MRFSISLFGLFLFLLFSCSPSPTIQRDSKKILYLSDDASSSRPQEYQQLFSDLAATGQFELDTSSNLTPLQEALLSDYSTIVINGLPIDSLLPSQTNALERYVEAGNGLIFIATSQLKPYTWHWLETMQATAQLPLQNAAFAGWSQDGGRVVRSDSTFTETPNSTQLAEAISYAIGKNQYDLSQVHTPLALNFNRFTRVVLDPDVYEPMELVVLPDLDVLYIERRGKMKRYDASTKETYLVAEFDVCKAGNYEDGLTGMTLDPGYGRSNHYIYVYYSPPCENPNQYLSRFVFKDDSLHWATEKVVLKVKVQRESCCHSAGSMLFGPDSLLYLSTGDNTIPFESDGFSPIDERPGHFTNDAQKSSANTHDLRGKILRIKVEEDATYTIPPGNLFPEDGSEGRPEIYIMGCRNPFRFAIDRKTNILYWGEIGPDGNKEGKYGPGGYDEFNQARVPGNYGWPHFVGNNFAYRDRNFGTGEAGDFFDPVAPLNDSPNNTGSQILPPAQVPMIWYPYAESEEFPMLGAGGRCALAGPIYYNDDNYLASSKEFPDYYNGKLFIYDWVRNWIKVLSFDDNKDLAQIEPFMPAAKIYGPIEMEFGPEGAMYTLEYGNGYFLKNPQAKLVRIEYASGNRQPIPHIQVDQANGALPHTTRFSAAQSFDYDMGDSLRYEWFFDLDDQVDASGLEVEHTFNQIGTYTVRLKVYDRSDAMAESSTTIQVGNSPPQVALNFQGNQSFFFPNKSLAYQTSIQDLEDEEKGGIQTQNAAINLAYVGNHDFVQGFLKGTNTLPGGSLQHLEGKRLINASDCRTCHLNDKKSNGPAYIEVAKKYGNDHASMPMLVNKIINGGAGVWGEERMSAHPQLSEEEVIEMIQYILSLDDVPATLPLSGKVSFKKQPETSGAYFLSAIYQDGGANGISPIQERFVQAFRSPRIEMEDFDRSEETNLGTFGENRDSMRIIVKTATYSLFKKIDLTDLRTVTFRVKPFRGGSIQLRLDEETGPIVGTLVVPPRSGKAQWKNIRTSLKTTEGVHDLYIEYVPPKADPNNNNGPFELDWMEFGL